MATSHCFFLPTLEIPTEFPTWCIPALHAFGSKQAEGL